MRLDMNVRSPLIESVMKKILHRVDDMAIGSLDLIDPFQLDVPLEVSDIHPLGKLPLRGLDRGAEPVNIRNDSLNIPRGRQHEVHVPSDELFDVVNQLHIERIGHGHGDMRIIAPNDQRVVPARERA